MTVVSKVMAALLLSPLPLRGQGQRPAHLPAKSVGWVKRLRATQQRRVRSPKYFGRYAHIFLLGRAALIARLECVRDVVLSGRCKSGPWEVTTYVAEGHCVAAMRGGEQSEANEQPVG